MSVSSIGAGASTSFASLPSVTQDLQKSALEAAEKNAQQRKTDAAQQAVLDEAKKTQQKTEEATRIQAQQQARAAQTAFYTQGGGPLDLYL